MENAQRTDGRCNISTEELLYISPIQIPSCFEAYPVAVNVNRNRTAVNTTLALAIVRSCSPSCTVVGGSWRHGCIVNSNMFPLFRKCVPLSIASKKQATLATRWFDRIKYCCNRIKHNDETHSHSVCVHILQRTDNGPLIAGYLKFNRRVCNRWNPSKHLHRSEKTIVCEKNGTPFTVLECKWTVFSKTKFRENEGKPGNEKSDRNKSNPFNIQIAKDNLHWLMLFWTSVTKSQVEPLIVQKPVIKLKIIHFIKIR